jgi:hypothetical protein
LHSGELYCETAQERSFFVDATVIVFSGTNKGRRLIRGLSPEKALGTVRKRDGFVTERKFFRADEKKYIFSLTGNGVTD